MDEDVKMEEDKPQNVEYVSEQLDVKDPALEAFSNVFARFQAPAETTTVRIFASLYLVWPFIAVIPSGPRGRAVKRRDHLLR